MELDLGPEWVPGGARVYRHATLGVRLYVDDAPSLPPTSQVDVISESTARSAAGWQVDRADKRVAVPGREVEHHLHARYHLFDALPLLVVAGPADQITAHRAELEAVVLSGRPARSAQAACLAHLLADVEE